MIIISTIKIIATIIFIIDNKNNNSQTITYKKQTLKTLIDEYFNDMKKIIDKDFYIFEFKSKVGYRNVLPLISLYFESIWTC